jgi:hypothetical protein
MTELAEFIEDRSDIDEGETYRFPSEMKSVIHHLDEGDMVKAVETSSQRSPEEPMRVTEDHLEEVRVTEYGTDKDYILTGIHFRNGVDGPFSWLRTLPERESAGQVLELKVIYLKGEGQ